MPHDAAQLSVNEVTPIVRRNEDLPADIRCELPPMIQAIFRDAYNLAWAGETSRKLADDLADERARSAAWLAVRSAYTQIGTTWILNRAA